MCVSLLEHRPTLTLNKPVNKKPLAISKFLTSFDAGYLLLRTQEEKVGGPILLIAQKLTIAQAVALFLESDGFHL